MKKILFLSFVFFSTFLKADQYSFLFYNDFFAGTDRHFTNGMSLSWIDDTVGAKMEDNNNSHAYSQFMLNTITKLPFLQEDNSKSYNAGISISQMAITPTDTSISTPQYDDIPYAGYLAASFYIFRWDTKSFNEVRVDLGVVGKESGAEFVQNTFHKLIGNSEAQGWDTQLGTQYIINSTLRYGEITWDKDNFHSFDMDWFNHAGLQLGNFSSNIFAGTMFRVGQNYIKNFNVHYPYMREEASMLKFGEDHKGFGWALSTGIDTQALFYSYILDEAVDEGYDTQKHTLGISLFGAIDLFYNLHKFTFLYQSHSPYTQKNETIDTFGGFVYSYQF